MSSRILLYIYIFFCLLMIDNPVIVMKEQRKCNKWIYMKMHFLVWPHIMHITSNCKCFFLFHYLSISSLVLSFCDNFLLNFGLIFYIAQRYSFVSDFELPFSLDFNSFFYIFIILCLIHKNTELITIIFFLDLHYICQIFFFNFDFDSKLIIFLLDK